MSKHTPGPWQIVRHMNIPGVIVAGVERQYANGKSRDQIVTVHGLSDDNGGEEARTANARLIAAAPDLLAALKAMLEQFNYHTISGIVHDESAAIDKAHAALKSAEEGK